MMQSKERITRENVMDILRRFAREYRKALGKAPAEIIIVGGGSIMLNYTFRDATQDLDVILRAVSGIYLIAMKMIAHRDYRNDVSDAIGILIEEAEAGNRFSYDEIEAAYRKLYHAAPDPGTQKQFREICAKSLEDLKALYDSRRDTESNVGEQLITYIEDGAKINTRNVKDVAAMIREKIEASKRQSG